MMHGQPLESIAAATQWVSYGLLKAEGILKQCLFPFDDRKDLCHSTVSDVLCSGLQEIDFDNAMLILCLCKL